MHSEHSGQAGSTPIVAVRRRIAVVDEHELGDGAYDEVRAHQVAEDDECLPHNSRLYEDLAGNPFIHGIENPQDSCNVSSPHVDRPMHAGVDQCPGRSPGEAPARAVFRWPDEGVVGNLLPAVLPNGVVRATWELVEVSDRLRPPVVVHVGLVDGRRHDVVVPTGMIHSYRHRPGLAPGLAPYDEIEQRLAIQPPITVPTITLDGQADGNFPATDGTASAGHFTGPRIHRQVPAGRTQPSPGGAPGLYGCRPGTGPHFARINYVGLLTAFVRREGTCSPTG